MRRRFIARFCGAQAHPEGFVTRAFSFGSVFFNVKENEQTF
jgi:hypothetical protein